jgi:hypothetical protein
MRQGPARSMIARMIGSDLLRWLTALRIGMPALLLFITRAGDGANEKRISVSSERQGWNGRME